MDVRSPLVLSTHELGRRPGAMRRVTTEVPAPDDLGGGLVGVTPGSAMALELRLEAVMEGVLVSGEVACEVAGECGRCLGALDAPLTVEVQELFVYPDRVVAEPEEDDDLPELVGDLLDLEPLLRDAIVTALPFQPLCRLDCPGLCPTCGVRLADVVGEHRHETLDPRWAGLQAFDAGTGGAGHGAGHGSGAP